MAGFAESLNSTGNRLRMAFGWYGVSFCFWRCYSTDSADLRRHITLYADTHTTSPNGEMWQLSKPDAGCTMVDDMFYCGVKPNMVDGCNVCDFDQ